MSKHRLTNALCYIVTACMLAVTVLFMMGGSLGITVASAAPPYADSLFSTERVHTLDIEVSQSDWQDMLDNAMNKEYIPCNVVIDGTAVKNVAIRPKGNSSLSTMATSDSDRYSFKIEFDHYENGKSYMGLDKLALNNLTQDTTCLKDYITYQMMNWFGADAPLSSFIYITVNGEDFGLYLAVEGIEEAFAERKYGSDYGQIYKPDTMNMGGNREGGGERMEMPDFTEMLGEENAARLEEAMGAEGEMDFDAIMEIFESASASFSMGGNREEGENARGGGMGGGMFGGGDVTLTYTDDSYDSYSNIFESARFPLTNAQKDRLIEALKAISEGGDLSGVVNIDEVLRYFTVHNFVLNFDSYTGSMCHNYYLYEEDGQLSMIAWDYNLAFGAFAGMGGGMGGGSGSTVDNGTSMVNFPIDTPTSGTTMEDRPLLGQLFANEEYLAEYHVLFDQFIADVFESGYFSEHMDSVISLISPYIEKDPTSFVTLDEFTSAASLLKEFCLLRAESIRGQLEGTIPSTDEGQAEDASALIDGSHIDINSMGTNFGGGGGGWGDRGNRRGQENTEDTDATAMLSQGQGAPPDMPADGSFPADGQMPSDGQMPARGDGSFPADGQMPSDGQMPARGEGSFTVAEPGASAPQANMENTASFGASDSNGKDASASSDDAPSDDGMDASAPPIASEVPPLEAAPPGDASADAAPAEEAPSEQAPAEDMQVQNQERGGGMGFMGFQNTQNQQNSYTKWIWLGGSAVLLLLGLVFAKLFK